MHHKPSKCAHLKQDNEEKKLIFFIIIYLVVVKEEKPLHTQIQESRNPSPWSFDEPSCLVLAATWPLARGRGRGAARAWMGPIGPVGSSAVYGCNLVTWPSLCYDPLKTWEQICKKVS